VRLRVRQQLDRARLRQLQRLHPGLSIHPTASTALATATFDLEPGAELVIGPGVVTEHRRDGVHFRVGTGARIQIGAGTWLRSDIERVRLMAFPGGRITIGPKCILNGCHLSAKSSLSVGCGSGVGPSSRVFDADQHDLDEAVRERVEPVVIGDYVWISTDSTVLRGVQIGDHCVVGARSLVTRSLPDHSLAYGSPARVMGKVGDRTDVPL